MTARFPVALHALVFFVPVLLAVPTAPALLLADAEEELADAEEEDEDEAAFSILLLLAIWKAMTPPKGPAPFELAILARHTFWMPLTVPVHLVPAGTATATGYGIVSV